MNKLLLIALIVGISFSVDAKKKEDNWRQNIQLEGVSISRSNAVVKVSIVDKKKDKVTEDIVGKCAVYGILFKGYVIKSTTNAGYGDSSQPALVGGLAAEQQHIDFFNPFFENGDYAKYVQLINDSRRVTKVGKEYKVSTTVSVNIEQLRKDLEQAGILRKLNSGW